MEILPLGPVLLTDTAGFDDEGELGLKRVEESYRVLENTDLALLVIDAGLHETSREEAFARRAAERKIPLIVVINKCDTHSSASLTTWARSNQFPVASVSAATGEGISQLKETLIQHAPVVGLLDHPIVGDLLKPDDIVLLVCPIDAAAPKGRLILPQVMMARDILDHHATACVVQVEQLSSVLKSLKYPPRLVITDSQAFGTVSKIVPRDIPLTSFSILMARYRADFDRLLEGTRALDNLRPGDSVLIAEGCTHHRQAVDIGTVQIPSMLREMAGGDLEIHTCSGPRFPSDVTRHKLIVHCGACTLNRREMTFRQREAERLQIPMTNYGMLLARYRGILERAIAPLNK
jgi:[FeFe] hydrogenase H-cluster maturation GTPase HydF